MNSTTRLMTIAIAAAVSAGAFAQIQETSAVASISDSWPINGTPNPVPQQTRAYENATTASGFFLPNGGAAVQGANTIVQLVGDDTTARIYAWGKQITVYRWSCVNNNAVAVPVRFRTRFWAANGANGGPGTLLAAHVFGTITLNPNTSNTITTAPLGTPFAIPADGKVWVGLTFDNNNGTLAAGVAELNNLGQLIYYPATMGSTQNLAFLSTGAGSFAASNPAGSLFQFSTTGNPNNASFLWYYETIQDPVTASGQILFNSYVAATPSSVNFEWYDTSSNLVAQQVEAVDPSGNFVADTPSTPGVYQMSMKTGTWLRRTLNVDTTAGNVSGLVFSLINGDIDNSNTIDSDDFDQLVANFGGSGPVGDIDGSGTVDSDDFDILVANFGTNGDGP